MKVIILNKKRLGVTVIILGLMVLLFGMERQFDQRLKEAALMYNNISALVKYEGLEKTFSYKLPKEWTASEKKFTGGEIIYHNDFTSQNQDIHGYVEVWNFNGDLKSFLEKSKEATFRPETTKYKTYSLSSIKVNNPVDKAYLLSYTLEEGAGKGYKGYEYFIGDKGRFYRFSFFVKEANFKETMPTIFKTIVNTLEHS